MNLTPARTPQAVLFDMDGTLVDSEKIWDVALDELAEHLGGKLSPEARATMVGANADTSVRLLHADLGITDADPDASKHWLLSRTKELFAGGMPWKAGALELLQEVRDAGIPSALVTSTHRALVEVALRTIGADFFDVIVCGDEVPRTKPAPDPYLQAARELGVDPRNCVAIEDSPTGITAAEAAGCAVLAIPSEVPVPPGKLRTIRETLLGVDVAYLGGLLAS